MAKTKATPKPTGRKLHARVIVFAPMAEVGELFTLADKRGWKTHSAMPFIDEGEKMTAVVSAPSAI